MAILFPQCSLPFSPSSFSNKGKLSLVHGDHNVRVPSLPKRRERLIIRCETAVTTDGATIAPADYPLIRRSDFPIDFKFGASTSALQSEGPADIGGRGPSTWDNFISPEDAKFESAALSYVHYKDDVQLLKKMGMDFYRFSISWSRILPKGKGEINEEGIKFYNNLINELLANGIQPFVTLFHFDLPQALKNEYNGFLDRKIVEDFKSYCDLCFKTFGDRVKFWGTINEPDVYAKYGYVQGISIENDEARLPYICAHNILLAHATVARHYKENYQATQGGKIGISMSLLWYEPYTDSKQDREAARRAFAFHAEWFLEPLVYGDYPFIMKSLVRDRLPEFTTAEKELVKGAYDFFGVNYYTSRYAKSLPITADSEPVSVHFDSYVDVRADKDGKPMGEEVHEGIFMIPDGLRDGLIILKQDYLNPDIYITENGCVDVHREPGATIEIDDDKLIEDDHRIKFISHHLKALQEALREGVNVKSYMVWSLIDVVELSGHYTVRLGLNHTNYETFIRTPKNSAMWFSKFLKKSIHANNTN